MAATVYNGVLQGNTTTHTQVLYTNSTGKNVRIVFNFITTADTSSVQTYFYFGPSSSPQHPSGQDLDTMIVGVPKNSIFGKSLATARTDNNTANHAYCGQAAFFPLEVVLANGSKISVNIPAQIDTNNNAISYNFVAITED
tara:strand:+ start:137 stop:559 length:423 start_codon:yes stop_codon:yes gene_type:complete